MNTVGIASAAGSVCLTLRVTVRLRPLTLTVTFFLTRTVFVSEHRFPFAASAEFGPCGRFSSNVETGTSGTGPERGAGDALGEMNVSRAACTVTPSP